MISYLAVCKFKKCIIFFFTIICLSLFTSCARKISFQTSATVPLAQGTIKIKKDKNSNYILQVSIIHLAPPDRLQPPQKVYVVWGINDDGGIKNLGQIKSSSSFLSKTFKASFSTATSFKPVKIFITAESDANVLNPGMQLVLTTNNF